MTSLFEEESNLESVEDEWAFEPAAEPEPEPVVEPAPVSVKHMHPGTVVLDDGRQFVYNRWVEVSEADADYLLSLKSAGRPTFVRSTT